MDAEPVTDDEVRNARHAYYGAISYIDDHLGRLMGALRSAGLAEDTVVVLTSDHGEMLGERGLWYKMSFFEGACRVPLVVANPHRFAPRRVASSVSLVDLFPTLIDISGSDAHLLGTPIDGRSLGAHLRGLAGHDEAIGEYLAEGALAPLVMIRRGDFKLIHSAPDPDQLFDLKRDPGERDNLTGKKQSAALVADFRAEIGRRWDLSELDQQVRASQRRRRLVDQALNIGEIRAWDFQPSRDAARQYIRNSVDLDDLEAMARFPRVGPRI
jgi:choline-sulfatase